MATKLDAFQAERNFRGIFEQVAFALSASSADNVVHYLDVSEPEMACESFVLAIIDEHIALDLSTRQALLQVCQAFQLDRESVFRHDFWLLATKYLAQSIGSAG